MNNALIIFMVAAIMAVIAAAAAIGGGLSIVIGPVSLGVVGSPLFAALLVFGAVIALAVAAVVLNCLIGAQPPSIDEVPPEEDGIQPEDLVEPGTSSGALTGVADSAEPDNSSGGASKPKPKYPKGPKRGTPANPVGGGGFKKTA
ncbi:hypothetical protein EI983_05595 [Roseovarius faecimaris]|uniref:Uncharacterized protein n=1 Tax=Roseovarius faecimaris TaxID=2494550 RepID=A0A6I6ILI1_9RHOB|nr:hypothetical protein [Roseovarius faecimaris]QGX97779.1 hypothetical protein EI983_05595 [Roseovarius faecimaris]